MRLQTGSKRAPELEFLPREIQFHGGTGGPDFNHNHHQLYCFQLYAICIFIFPLFHSFSAIGHQILFFHFAPFCMHFKK